MSAAWLLSKSHTVTVYEQDRRIGGHTNTVEVPDLNGPIPVDTGFIVYNEANYPNLVALFEHLGVPSKPSEMSFAASVDDGALEYSGSGLAGLFAQKSNFVRPRFWRMLGDVWRFYREGPAIMGRPGGDDESLGDYLHREGYSHAFVYDHLLPMAAAIWSTAAHDMRDHPASAFIRFCTNHGLMKVANRPQWRTVDGGSREYARRLTASYAANIRTGVGVRSIRRSGRGAIVEDQSGRTSTFDHVVIAAHADQALAMLSDPSADERNLLGAFGYTRNTAVLHQDPTLMPQRRKVWSSWNYLSRSGEDGASRVCVTYWMNRLQGLVSTEPLLVTLNPNRDPDPRKILRTFEYEHPSFDVGAMNAQRRLWNLQGARNTWFCGSYFGAGFHEDALQAGLAVAETLGGLPRPWTVIVQSDRIHVPVPTRLETAA
jgi:predicted NAD/FAD-binding protein